MTISDKRPRLALSVAGFDPSAGAGVLADARTFEALGVFPQAAVTSVTFQNTEGVIGKRDLDAGDVVAQVETLARSRKPHAVKTGMLGAAGTAVEVARLLARLKLGPLVVDPVMRSSAGVALIGDGGMEALNEELLPRASLVTPNAAELAELCGFEVFDVDDVKTAALSVSKRSRCSVLATGLRREGAPQATAVDVFLHEGAFEVFEEPWMEGLDVHGTGCVLSAAITALLALGRDLPEAVLRGRAFALEAIRGSLNPGHTRAVAYPRTVVTQRRRGRQ